MQGNGGKAVIGCGLGGAADRPELRRGHLSRVLKDKRRLLVIHEGKAFQVEEIACAMAQGKKEQRTAGLWFLWSLQCVKR